MDKKTGSFRVRDGKGAERRVDEYHDLMASGALGMKHYILDDGRKVTHVEEGRYVIDITREELILIDEPEPA
jgi:hypothetical protein